MEPEKQKLIDRLKADERRWPIMRWSYVVLGGGLFAFGAHLFLYTVRSVSEDPTSGIAVATLFLPIVPLPWIFGAILVREAVHKWSGDPVRQLLLKLVDDAVAKEKSESQHAGRG